MCPKQSDFNELKGWTPPVFHQGKECYVSFTAFCPETGKMRKKKFMLDRIKSKRLQKLKGKQMCQRLTEKLLDGWNPWIEAESPSEYTTWEEVCYSYENYIDKMSKEKGLRPETIASYTSYLKILKEWIEDKNVHYSYQFNRRIVGKFLDYVFVERNVSLQTRNNYLSWLKTFSKFMLARAFVSKDPTEGVPSLVHKHLNKNRDSLSESDLIRLKEYLQAHNRHFLLATYILYYTFLRPHEMSCIKIDDISIKGQTIRVWGENAKNHNDAVVTMPKKILKLMLELDVFSHPGSHYLFSRDFRPGTEYRSEKCFRDYWSRVLRKELGFSSRYKFYSLKDTGITNMLRKNIDAVSVRDQARHSSIEITNIYVSKSDMKANKSLLDYDDDF